MTFLQLVNFVIRESGSDVDQLSTTILTGNTIQSKFCNWVVQAWEDLQTEWRAAEFMRKQGVVVITPRIHFYDCQTGYQTSTSMNTVELTINSDPALTYTIRYFSPASGSAISTPTEGYIDLQVDPEVPLVNFIPAGMYINTANTSDDRSVQAYFKHWGHYSLYDNHYPYSTTDGWATDTSDIAEIDKTTLRLFNDTYQRDDPASGNFVDYGDAVEVPITYLSWEEYCRRRMDVNTVPGCPQFVTESPDGELVFYPPVDKVYTLRFSYTKVPQTFSSDSDTPTGLATRFHQAIGWAALKKYASYDEQPALLSRAQDELDMQMAKLRRDVLPKVTVRHSYYDW